MLSALLCLVCLGRLSVAQDLSPPDSILNKLSFEPDKFAVNNQPTDSFTQRGNTPDTFRRPNDRSQQPRGYNPQRRQGFDPRSDGPREGFIQPHPDNEGGVRLLEQRVPEPFDRRGSSGSLRDSRNSLEHSTEYNPNRPQENPFSQTERPIQLPRSQQNPFGQRDLVSPVETNPRQSYPGQPGPDVISLVRGPPSPVPIHIEGSAFGQRHLPEGRYYPRKVSPESSHEGPQRRIVPYVKPDGGFDHSADSIFTGTPSRLLNPDLQTTGNTPVGYLNARSKGNNQRGSGPFESPNTNRKPISDQFATGYPRQINPNSHGPVPQYSGSRSPPRQSQYQGRQDLSSDSRLFPTENHSSRPNSPLPPIPQFGVPLRPPNPINPVHVQGVDQRRGPVYGNPSDRQVPPFDERELRPRQPNPGREADQYSQYPGASSGIQQGQTSNYQPIQQPLGQNGLRYSPVEHVAQADQTIEQYPQGGHGGQEDQLNQQYSPVGHGGQADQLNPQYSLVAHGGQEDQPNQRYPPVGHGGHADQPNQQYSPVGHGGQADQLNQQYSPVGHGGQADQPNQQYSPVGHGGQADQPNQQYSPVGHGGQADQPNQQYSPVGHGGQADQLNQQYSPVGHGGQADQPNQQYSPVGHGGQADQPNQQYSPVGHGGQADQPNQQYSPVGHGGQADQPNQQYSPVGHGGQADQLNQQYSPVGHGGQADQPNQQYSPVGHGGQADQPNQQYSPVGHGGQADQPNQQYSPVGHGGQADQLNQQYSPVGHGGQEDMLNEQYLPVSHGSQSDQPNQQYLPIQKDQSSEHFSPSGESHNEQYTPPGGHLEQEHPSPESQGQRPDEGYNPTLEPGQAYRSFPTAATNQDQTHPSQYKEYPFAGSSRVDGRQSPYDNSNLSHGASPEQTANTGPNLHGSDASPPRHSVITNISPNLPSYPSAAGSPGNVRQSLGHTSTYQSDVRNSAIPDTTQAKPGTLNDASIIPPGHSGNNGPVETLIVAESSGPAIPPTNQSNTFSATVQPKLSDTEVGSRHVQENTFSPRQAVQTSGTQVPVLMGSTTKQPVSDALEALNPSHTHFVLPGLQGQCYKYKDLSTGYSPSGDAFEYPDDAISAEMRERTFLAPILGFKNFAQPNPQFGLIPFGSLNGNNNQRSNDYLYSENVYPTGYKDGDFKMATPSDYTCRSTQTTLRMFKLYGGRCWTVNPDYQRVSYKSCGAPGLQCGNCSNRSGTSGGGGRCSEDYEWVKVWGYCEKAPPGQRVRQLRLYLPTGCSCKTFYC